MLTLERVSKKFSNGTVALREVSFKVNRGDFLSVVGPSGSGKTTLLRLLRRELLPSKGEIFFKDWDLTKLSEAKVIDLRRKIAVVFQDYKLLEERTVFENVALTLEVMSIRPQEIKERVEEVLKEVGLWEKRSLFPLQLSGGEIQRTAVARATVGSPEVILADEPTADLDPATSWEIIGLLDQINKKDKTMIILATHDFDIVDTLKRRVITLDRGYLVSDVKKGKYDGF